MHRRFFVLAVVAGSIAAVPAAAQAHVSLHPNAIPAGSFVTTNIRVPDEEDNAGTTSVKVKLPAGVLSALGAPPAGWSFKATLKKLSKPIKTDDGLVTTETTQVAFTGGRIKPGGFQNFPLTLSIPDSAKAGDVLSFPTVQTYSDGKVVRWIGAAESEMPAPTVDITSAGGALLDVTGGDAGPPTTLPANLLGAAAAAAVKPAATVVKKETSGLAVVALIIGALGLILGGAALATRRGKEAYRAAPGPAMGRRVRATRRGRPACPGWGRTSSPAWGSPQRSCPRTRRRTGLSGRTDLPCRAGCSGGRRASCSSVLRRARGAVAQPRWEGARGTTCCAWRGWGDVVAGAVGDRGVRRRRLRRPGRRPDRPLRQPGADVRAGSLLGRPRPAHRGARQRFGALKPWRGVARALAWGGAGPRTAQCRGAIRRLGTLARSRGAPRVRLDRARARPPRRSAAARASSRSGTRRSAGRDVSLRDRAWCDRADPFAVYFGLFAASRRSFGAAIGW